MASALTRPDEPLAFETDPLSPPRARESMVAPAPSPDDGRCRVFIEGIRPELDGGAYAPKRVVGDVVTISVDLTADGHDVIAGELIVRAPEPSRDSLTEGTPHPRRLEHVPLRALGNDRYSAQFKVDTVGEYEFAIRAWVDHFATWRRGLERKVQAGQDVAVDVLVGAELVGAAAARAHGVDRSALDDAFARITNSSEPVAARARAALEPGLAEIMARHPDREHAASSRWLPLWVDRVRARFSSWYEMFPRSTGPDGQHGTFQTAKAMLPYIASMGFDVLYLPPIHPIGHTFRKGKNNNPNASPGDVGSPWAIGSEDGGHKSVHPDLGTLEDFDDFRREAERHGLEIALDIALQVTPDHPYVKEHPEWFKKRPDGTIQYAENPPKKYQDIYPFDFECEAWWSLWQELKSIFDFWIARGVYIFRVDNPHTKSLAFWRWCIGELRNEHPNVIFLAEAFTRPKLMYALAKLGFTQSYTYFTWRSTGRDLKQYMEELNSYPVREFYRPNFWPNTPDILPEHLQYAGRTAFSLRLVLAATLSSNYGIYGPAFELMENVPRGDVEEYVDNEKYELKRWDINREHSLRSLITRINRIRHENPALQQNDVTFHDADNDLLLCFSKRSPDGQSAVLVVVNMDVHHAQSGWIDLNAAGLIAPGTSQDPDAPLRDVQLHDLLSDSRYFSEGRRLFVRLDPWSAPAHIFRLRRRARTEHDFDYFV